MSELFNKIYLKNKALPWQTIGGETIIINPDSQSSFELNEIGSFIWSRLDGNKTLGEVQEEICKEYDVSAENVTKDLAELVVQMQESNLIITRT